MGEYADDAVDFFCRRPDIDDEEQVMSNSYLKERRKHKVDKVKALRDKTGVGMVECQRVLRKWAGYEQWAEGDLLTGNLAVNTKGTPDKIRIAHLMVHCGHWTQEEADELMERTKELFNG